MRALWNVQLKAGRRIPGRTAVGRGWRKLCAGILLCGLVFSAPALDTNRPAAAPALKPPHGEIPPGFWEQHTAEVVIAGILFLGVSGLVVWFVRRPKPPVITPPAVVARRQLESLRDRSEDGALLSQVSQVLRRYFTGGTPVEFTTTEVCRVISQRPEWTSEVGASACEFLRRCDEQKFSPAPPQSQGGGTVVQAIDLLERAEAARRAQADALAPQTAAHNSANGSGPKQG